MAVVSLDLWSHIRRRAETE